MAGRHADAAPARQQVPVAATAPDADGLSLELAYDGNGNVSGRRCRCGHGGCAFGMKRLGFGGGVEDVECRKLQGIFRDLLIFCEMTASSGVGRSIYARFGAVPTFTGTPPYLAIALPFKYVSILHQEREYMGEETVL